MYIVFAIVLQLTVTMIAINGELAMTIIVADAFIAAIIDVDICQPEFPGRSFKGS